MTVASVLTVVLAALLAALVGDLADTWFGLGLPVFSLLLGLLALAAGLSWAAGI